MTALRAVACDLGGMARGKRLPGHMMDKLTRQGLRLPFSVINVDFLGDDVGAVFASGDPDGLALPTGRGPVPMPWLSTPTQLVPMWMHHEDGRAWDGCPRQALAAQAARLGAMGLTASVGLELEFYLIDDTGDVPRYPASPRSGRRHAGSAILSGRMLDAFDALLSEIEAGAEAMGIALDSIVSEAGPGQFEVVMERAEALRAADDAWLLRQLIHGIARRHGLLASFAAKPWEGASGNGLHAHLSLSDAGGNVFDDGSPWGGEVLGHAVAGVLGTMRGASLIFAPHAASWARFVDEAHAPTGIGWGRDNRTTAVRIPAGPGAARRLEHRVAGTDANPYLLLSVILGGAANGLQDRAAPPPATIGNAYAQELPNIAPSWAAAVEALGTDPAVARCLPARLIANLQATKRQEAKVAAAMDPDTLAALHLDLL
ncbi:MAG: glutamine synthetase family protein [Paracoccaceae bacterium]